MAQNVNVVVITGNLTRDPELKHLPNGTPVVEMGVAVNGRRQDAGGNWVDKPNFFDVKVYGRRAETVAQYLEKGSGVAVDGRLDWRSWETAEGQKRSKVEIVADNVQFLPKGDGSGGGSRSGGGAAAAPDADFGGADFPTATDDDIPF